MKIIAELGSNWKTFEDCKNAIQLANTTGADAIKFQLYTHKELYGLEGEIDGSMPREWIARLADKADAVGIEFMCTAFSADGLKFIDPYVKTHKLASSEMCHTEMLAELVKFKKHVYVSTGAQTITDILAVKEALKSIPTTFLYCEASYPARHVDLRKMELLSKLVQTSVGFSDHTTDIFTIPKQAKLSGAQVLEKHFNPFDYFDTPDATHSLDVEDFRSMIRSVNEDDDDTCDWSITKNETPMLLRHKRRLICTQEIKAGEQLKYKTNYGIYRSKQDDISASHPAMATKIDGKACKNAKKIGDPIGLIDV